MQRTRQLPKSHRRQGRQRVEGHKTFASLWIAKLLALHATASLRGGSILIVQKALQYWRPPLYGLSRRIGPPIRDSGPEALADCASATLVQAKSARNQRLLASPCLVPLSASRPLGQPLSTRSGHGSRLSTLLARSRLPRRVHFGLLPRSEDPSLRKRLRR